MLNTYTPSQVSEYLQVPSSTIRRYAAVYSDFLSEQAHGARRTYTAADLDVLREVRDLHRSGLTGDMIKEHLKNYVVIEHQVPEPPPPVEGSNPTQALALREELLGLQTLLSQMLDEQKAMRDELTQLRSELGSRRRWWRFWDR